MLSDVLENKAQCHESVTTAAQLYPTTPRRRAAPRPVSARTAAASESRRDARSTPRSPRRAPLKVHQRRAGVPSGVQLDVPQPGRGHRLTPVPRQHRRRVRVADLVAAPHRRPTGMSHPAPAVRRPGAAGPSSAPTPVDPAAAVCAATSRYFGSFSTVCRRHSRGCWRSSASWRRGRRRPTAARRSHRGATPTTPAPTHARAGRRRSR